MVDMVIKGGKIVTSEGIISAGIAVEGGRIVAIASDQHLPDGTQTIDVGGRYILPGVVDQETHVGSKNPLEQDLQTESCAALAGGVTTWGFHLPSGRLAIPPTGETPFFSQVLPNFVKVGNQHCRTDYFLTPILVEEKQIKEIPELAERFGITSYKFFLQLKFAYKFLKKWPAAETTYGFKTDFDDGMVYQSMELISRLGPPGIACFHCENWEIARVFWDRLIEEGRKDAAAWSERSPHFCEAGHIRTYAYYAKQANCPIYINHVTTEESVQAVLSARADGVRIFGNTQAIYLAFSCDSDWIWSPPLRDRETMGKLWQALSRGITDTISSDHVNLIVSREELLKHDVWTRPPGPNRADMLLPIMLSEGVNKDRISLPHVVQVACENPARIFGLYPKKGTIRIGSDADFVVVDLDLTRKVNDNMILSSCSWTIFDGWEMKGWPVMVILRGDVVMEWPEGEIKPKIIGAAKGRYLPRVPGHASYPLD